MINKGSRAGSGKKPHLRLLDLTFDNGVTKTEPQPKPHGGLRGSKKHPLSPYSFNKTSEYHVQLRDDINKLFREEFFDGRGSPAWAFDISKEITHSGESPFHVHGLLSTSKLESETSSVHNIRRSVTPASSARNTPRKRNTGSSFYHPPSPHQYLTATDTSQLSAKELKYGRPTRTTLLRARQRCASAPVNSYDVRRELVKTVDIDEVDNPDTFRYTDHCLSCRGTPKNGAWFNIYSVTYTFLLLSLLYGWWLNFYGIFFYSDLHGMNIFSWLSTYLEHHQWNISLISLYLMDFL